MLSLPLVNIANNGKDIILFSRFGRELRITKDITFLPYFFEPSAKGIFITIDGKKVNKVFCRRPGEVKQKRTEFSYEADILFTKRYIIDKISDFRPAELKYSFVDIEVITKELPSHLNPIHPISCISCSNSYTNEIKTFFLNYYGDYDGRTYALDLEAREKLLLNSFVEWIRKEQFDMLLGWNFIAFDYVYLSARYKHLFGVELADMLSPLNQNRWLSKSKVDMQEILAPAGLSIIDYLDFFKKVYRTESSYALDVIAQKYLNEESIGKFDFSKLTEEIKVKNIKDVQRMIDLDKKLKLIAYYDEIRRMGKCLWEDLTWYSKVLDVMLLSEAKQKGIILPSKRYSEDVIDEVGFEGAYRRCETGRFEGLWKVDLSSAYPASIINFCLDIANLTNITTEQKIDITDRETNEIKQTIYVKQNFNAVLPTLARKLVAKKDTLKRQLKALDPESEEAKDLQIKYDAIKALVNSLFGVCGLKVFRLFDYRIASAITSIVRDLLHYVEDKVQTLGMKVIYLDTDSFFIDAKENPTELLNSLIKQWAKEKYNKDSIDIEFDCEGRFSTLLVIALCHYVGDLETKKGVKREIKGVEAKRKDSSVFMKKFQEELIDMILKDKSREAIETFIASQKEAIKQAPLIDIGFPCKVNNEKVYKSPPIFHRALEYTKELVPTFDKVSGDSFYYIYVESFGTAQRKSSRMWKNKATGEKELQHSDKEVNKDVLAFDAETYAHVTNVNWDEMMRKTINEKVEHIFEALKWNQIIKVKEIEKNSPVIINESQEILAERKELIPYFETNTGKLYNCDCIELLKSLPEDSIDIVFTSPPYNTGGAGKNKGMYKTYSDNLSDSQYYTLLSTVIAQSLRICKGAIFVNMNYMTNNKKVLYQILSDYSDYLRENIIWKKDRVQPPIGNILGKRYEYIFVFTKNAKFEINNFRVNKAKNYPKEFGSWISNLIEVSIKTDQTKYSKINRAGFPLDLPKMFIDIYTKEDGVVLDPFMGMGTTAIAAEILHRRWIGAELLEHSCSIIKERLTTTDVSISE